MKSRLFLIVVALALVLVSCAKATPAPAATPTPAPAATPTPAPAATPTPAPVKTIELRLAHPLGATHHLVVNYLAPWAREVESRTGGRVKVTLYGGETLVKYKDAYDGVAGGIADVAFFIPGYTPGRFPLSDVIGLPFLTLPSAAAASEAAWATAQKYLIQEYSEVKLLALSATAAYDLMMVEKPVRSLEDLKGMRIRSPGVITPALELMGAVPVAMSAGEIYVALERGVLDGTVFDFAGGVGRALHEVTQYGTEAGFYHVKPGLAMNLKVWQGLPKDIQDIITEVSNEAAVWLGQSYDRERPPAVEKMKARGIEIITLAPQELERWRQVTRPVWDDWLAKMEAKGLPGQEVLDYHTAQLEKRR